MQEPVESVSRQDVLHPALLLPIEGKEGSYYYIAGHQRGLASEKAGLGDIPAIIKDISMDEAKIGNNINQIAHVANSTQGADATMFTNTFLSMINS